MDSDPLERIRKIDPDRVRVQIILRNALVLAGLLMGVVLYLILTVVFLWGWNEAILPAVLFGAVMMMVEYLVWRMMTKTVAKRLESGDLKPL